MIHQTLTLIVFQTTPNTYSVPNMLQIKYNTLYKSEEFEHG